jgi:hypothetical protein
VRANDTQIDSDNIEDDEEKRLRSRSEPMSALKKSTKRRQAKIVKSTAPFNAASYLYLSYRLAKEFPAIKASQIILQYSTPWPKQSYAYSHDVSSEYAGSVSAITKAISLVLVFLLSNILQVPLAMQDMIMNMISTVTIGYTILLHLHLYDIYPVLVVVPLIFLCLLLHFVVKAWNRQSEVDRLIFLQKIRGRLSGKREVATFAPSGQTPGTHQSETRPIVDILQLPLPEVVELSDNRIATKMTMNRRNFSDFSLSFNSSTEHKDNKRIEEGYISTTDRDIDIDIAVVVSDKNRGDQDHVSRHRPHLSNSDSSVLEEYLTAENEEEVSGLSLSPSSSSFISSLSKLSDETD